MSEGTGNQPAKNSRLKNVTLLVLILAILLVLVAGAKQPPRQNLGQLFRQLDAGQVYSLEIDGDQIRWWSQETRGAQVARGILSVENLTEIARRNIHYVDPDDPEIVYEHIQIRVLSKESPYWVSLLSTWAPFMVLIFLWFYFLQKMGGGVKVEEHKTIKPRRLDPDQNPASFEAIGGQDQAKEQLADIVTFLKDPSRLATLGAHLPRSILIEGPHGTGKTQLTHALAKEAGVPLLETSAADYVDTFVGTAAARIKSLFEQGQKAAPCVLFIDDIEGLGKVVEGSATHGRTEQEQALIQLVHQLDQAKPGSGILLVVSTSRPELIDPGLMRPGRLDRRVTLVMPDPKARQALFRVHLKRLKVADEIDLPQLAHRTHGKTGADIASYVNEAAILAARRQREAVTMADLIDAIETHSAPRPEPVAPDGAPAS